MRSKGKGKGKGSLAPRGQMDTPEERALRADAPNTDGDFNFVRRSALTDSELAELQKQGGSPKDIDETTGMIDTWDIPEGAILDKLDIWRLPVGFYFRQWEQATGTTIISNELNRWKMGIHKDTDQNKNGPMFCRREEDPIAPKLGGWRIHVKSLHPLVTPWAIVDKLRIDVPLWRKDPNDAAIHLLKEVNLRGAVVVKPAPSWKTLGKERAMKQAWVTAETEKWCSFLWQVMFTWSMPHVQDGANHWVTVNFFHPMTYYV